MISVRSTFISNYYSYITTIQTYANSEYHLDQN